MNIRLESVAVFVAGILIACGSDRNGATSNQEDVPTPTSAASCVPRILQLERRVDIQVSSEWMTASLYAAGCAEALNNLRAEDRAAATAVLKERATTEPSSGLRTCDDSDRPPDPVILGEVTARLSREVITDWCWVILTISGPS